MSNRKLAFAAIAASLLAAAQPATAQVTLRFGHQNAPAHSIHLGALKFAELVDKKTNGSVKVQVFPSAQLGGLNDLWTGVKIGSIDISGSLPATVAQDLVPSLSVYDAPYIFTGIPHFEKVWRGPIGQEINEELVKKAGVRILYMQTFGVRHLTANKAIKRPEDLAGMKIRSVTLPVFMATVEGMGGTPTPLDFAEVYQGLRSGVVDGQENPVASIFTARFQEVQSHLMLTGHIFGNVTALINESTFKRLKPDQQKALIEAGIEAGTYADEQSALQEKDYMDKLKAAGMTIIGPEQGLDVAAFRTRVRNAVIPKLAEKWPPGLADRVAAEAK